MAVFESIKDLFGVMDDAQDFVDRIDKKVKEAFVILNKFEKASGELKDQLESIERYDELEDAKRILQKMDIESPKMFGKTVLQKLESIKDDLNQLMFKLKEMPREIQTEVLPHFTNANSLIADSIQKHIKALRVLDAFQNQHQEFYKDILSSVVFYTGVSALVSTAGYATMGYTIRYAAAGVFGIIMKNLFGVSKSLGRGSKTLTDSVRKVSKSEGA